MKVYVVRVGNMFPVKIVGIYTDKSVAEDLAKKVHDDCWLEAIELDHTPDDYQFKPCWKCNGEGKGCPQCGGTGYHRIMKR